MPTDTLQVVWKPSDATEVFERAATMHATGCPHYVVMYGERFGCDATHPHINHTNAALKVRWAGSL
jgi:hypothetical protein